MAKKKKTASSGKKPGVPADVRKGTVHEWLDGVRTVAESAVAAGKTRGACLVSDPIGGPAMCVFVDEATCKLMKGTFVGGPC